jgi:hypothetical protein
MLDEDTYWGIIENSLKDNNYSNGPRAIFGKLKS